MNVVNAIAKARFGSARPQRIVLHKDDAGPAELLCFEPGQTLKVQSGQWSYYVVTGRATLECNGSTSQLAPGQFAAGAPDEPHTLSNPGEQRLICLALGRT